MSLLHSLLTKLGIRRIDSERHPIRVFLLDDDRRRHKWFAERFKGDFIDMAHNVRQAQQLLGENSYDAIFLDHDLHPEHYTSLDRDDERTGYAIASWLAANPGKTATLAQVNGLLAASRLASGAIPLNFFHVPAPQGFATRTANSFDITTLEGLKLYRLRQTYDPNFGTLFAVANPRYIQFGVKINF